MTTLYIRPAAQASVDGQAAALCPCQYALAGADGRPLLQGEAALGGLGGVLAKARRVLLLLAAPDVTLLRVKTPPLSAARLRAALPGLVEEQILGDPADCVLAAGAPDGDAMRTVAVARRSWLEALLKTLQGQGARHIGALPAQLCLPLRADGVSAALNSCGAGLELTLRLGAHDGLGLMLAPSAPAALEALRACAGAAPVTLYLEPAQRAALDASSASSASSMSGMSGASGASGMSGASGASSVFGAPGASANASDVSGAPGVTFEAQQWAHWIAGAASAGPDLAAAAGLTGGPARDWRRWRWPLRLAALTVLVNIAGVNFEWLRLKRDADALRQTMAQTFKATYPNEAPLMPAAQMRRNIAAAKLAAGEMPVDDFSALSAALGEALGGPPGKGALTALEYRERALIAKFKPDTFDAAAVAQVRAALAARTLQLSEAAPGTWQVRAGAGLNPGAKP